MFTSSHLNNVFLWYIGSRMDQQRKKMSFSMHGLEFIYMPASPPCRAVWMCIRALGISEVDYRAIDMYKKAEHTQSWFVKVMASTLLTPHSESIHDINSWLDHLQMNPQHTVPTINDDGFILWERYDVIVLLFNMLLGVCGNSVIGCEHRCLKWVGKHIGFNPINCWRKSGNFWSFVFLFFFFFRRDLTTFPYSALLIYEFLVCCYYVRTPLLHSSSGYLSLLWRETV